MKFVQVVPPQTDEEINHLEDIYMGLKGLGYLECADENWKYDGYIVDGYPVLDVIISIFRKIFEIFLSFVFKRVNLQCLRGHIIPFKRRSVIRS